jgi:hypothetical protein
MILIYLPSSFKAEYGRESGSGEKEIPLPL